MQPQGHVQMAVNMIDFALNPQESLDAPRWQWFRDRTSASSRVCRTHVAAKLAAMDHDVRMDFDRIDYGRGQIIQRTESGALVGATERAQDGYVAAW